MKTGSIVKFTKYAEAPPENPLEAGAFLTVVGKAKDKGSFTLRPFGVDDDSQDVVLYDDEFETGFTPKDAEAAADAEAPVKGKKGGKAKGKTEAAAPEKKSKLKQAPKPAKAAKKGGKLAGGAAKKTGKVKAKKEPKPVKEPVVITYTKDVEKAMRGKSALEAAQSLEAGQRLSRWTFAGVMSKIKQEKLFLTIGDGYDDSVNGFTAFINEHLDTDYRSVMADIKKYEHYRALGVTEDQISKVGWSSLDMLISVTPDAESAEKWLGLAEETTKDKLFEKVKKERIRLGTKPALRGKQGNSETVTLTHLHYQVFEDQANNIHKAIESAKDLMKGEDISDSQAIYFIISEWMKENG